MYDSVIIEKPVLSESAPSSPNLPVRSSLRGSGRYMTGDREAEKNTNVRVKYQNRSPSRIPRLKRMDRGRSSIYDEDNKVMMCLD
jgi:hypothetical protein